MEIQFKDYMKKDFVRTTPCLPSVKLRKGGKIKYGREKTNTTAKEV